MTEFISGGLVMGYLVAGLFFLRFWKATADRLFLIFGIAFGILAVQRSLLVVLEGEGEAHVSLYVIRLLAFILIVYAIIEKNSARPSG